MIALCVGKLAVKGLPLTHRGLLILSALSCKLCDCLKENGMLKDALLGLE